MRKFATIRRLITWTATNCRAAICANGCVVFSIFDRLAAAKENAPKPLEGFGALAAKIFGAEPTGPVDQRFKVLLMVGMKNAKRKIMKATQKDTHPSSFTLCSAIFLAPLMRPRPAQPFLHYPRDFAR